MLVRAIMMIVSKSKNEKPRTERSKSLRRGMFPVLQPDVAILMSLRHDCGDCRRCHPPRQLNSLALPMVRPSDLAQSDVMGDAFDRYESVPAAFRPETIRESALFSSGSKWPRIIFGFRPELGDGWVYFGTKLDYTLSPQ